MQIDLKCIKLIILDLNEIFWNGTLSEKSVVPNDEYIEVIEKLSYRGIINSICSKNDFVDIQKEFNKIIYEDVLNFFVFNFIDWYPKGLRIKNIIDNMQLRVENVLFIDDNVGNLEEAKYYRENIKNERIILPSKAIL